MNIRTLGLVVLALALAILVFPRVSQAVTLIPPSLEFTAKPGELINTKVKLFNETAEGFTQYSSTANFTAKDETGTPAFAPETDVKDLASWMALGKGPFTLNPGDRLEIPVEIRVPVDAEPGGHFAGIFFSSQPPESTGGGQIAITSKVGALVLVRIEGEINEAASVVSFATADGQKSFNRPPVDFALRVRNDGNVHVRPTGEMTIRNLLGGTTSVIAMNAGQGAVLPQSIRRFAGRWERQTNAPGQGNFFQEIGREWRNFAFGPYTGSVSLTYGLAKDKTATASVNFWVFPWRVLLLSVLVIIGAILLLIASIKRYNRWILSRAQPPAMK